MRTQEEIDVFKSNLAALDLSTEEIDQLTEAYISKGESSDDDNDDYSEEEFEKKKAECDKLQKAFQDSQADLDKYASKKKKDMNKSEENDLLKSEIVDLLKSMKNDLEESRKQNSTKDDLIKSMGEELSSLKEEVLKISKADSMKRGIHNLNFIEKGEQLLSEDGKRVVSVTRNKEDLIKAASDFLEGYSGSDKEIMENELISYNAGNTPLSRAFAQRLEKSEDIKIIG